MIIRKRRDVMDIKTVLLILALPAVGSFGYFLKAYIGKIKLNSAETKSQKIIDEAIRDAESKRKELLIEAKDQLLRERNLFEKEMRDRRQEIQNVERKFVQKEEFIEKREEQAKRREKILQLKEQETPGKRRGITQRIRKTQKRTGKDFQPYIQRGKTASS